MSVFASLQDLCRASEEVLLRGEVDLPEAHSESNSGKIGNWQKNKRFVCFHGAVYDVHTPAVIPRFFKAEFLTSYTPYQPEVSQGTLQYILNSKG